MTITESFIDFLETKGIATFGQDLFLRRVPSSLDTLDSVYWIIPNGGFPLGRNKTGEMMKQYSFLIYFRSTKAEDVEQKLFALEEMLNCESCVALTGYEVTGVEVSSFSTDSDIDAENREQGMLQVNINIYKQGC